MTALSPLKPATAIAVMHARYEAAWLNDLKLEQAEAALVAGVHENDVRKYHYGDARKVIAAETDALRLTILYQVPTSWADALILQFHIWGIADLLASYEDRSESEDKALLIALDSLFDFMATEIPEVDHESVGAMFKSGTMLAWKKQRQRAAELED